MDISKSRNRRDRTLQLIRQDSKPLTLKHRLSCSTADDINNLEEVIDLDRDLERYQKDTLRKINHNMYIIWVYLKAEVIFIEYLEK